MPEESQETQEQTTVLGGEEQPGGEEKPGEEQPGGEEKPGEEKPGEEKPGEEGEVPEAYDFQMPEGMELDQGLADAATPLLQKYKVTQEDAQALADAIAASRTAEGQASYEAFTAQLDSWGEELKNDADFGGDGFDENANATLQFIEKTLPDDLKPLLLGKEGLFETTGIGSHPALVKYFFHLSKTFPVGEDTPAGSTGGGSGGETDMAKRMYKEEAKA